MKLRNPFRSRRDNVPEFARIAWPDTPAAEDAVRYFAALTGKREDVIAWELCAYRFFGLVLVLMAAHQHDIDVSIRGFEEALRGHVKQPFPQNFEEWWVARAKKYMKADDGVTTLDGRQAEGTREFLEAIGCEWGESTVIRAYAELKQAVTDAVRTLA